MTVTESANRMFLKVQSGMFLNVQFDRSMIK